MSEDSEDEIEDDSPEDEIEDNSSEDEIDRHGLKKRCSLNQLEAFHAVLGFPPDCMHDLLEGVAAQDLYGGIRILSIKGWFTLEEYNQKLKSLGYPSYEASDRPEPVPKKAKKMPGKACSVWTHVRNFPLIARDLVQDPEDEILEFLLKLVEITSRITAPEFRNHEIDALEEKMIEYLDARKLIFASYPEILGTPKPKASHQNSKLKNVFHILVVFLQLSISPHHCFPNFTLFYF